MEDKAIRGIRWTLLGYASTRAVGLVTTFILARLLVPSDFGLVAFGSLVVSLVGHFGGLGIASAVVVSQGLDRRQLGTALFMLIRLNAASALVLAAASPLVGGLLDEPRAAGVIIGLSVPLALGGFTSFYAAVLQRELLFRRNLACQAGQVTVTAATSLALAALGADVWSLVGGQIAGALASTVLLIRLAPYRVSSTLDKTAARSLWRSGRGFMFQGGFSFVEQNADYLIVGNSLGPRALGLYSMAYRISELPYNAIVEPIAQTTFPGFARMRHRSEDVTPAFLTALRLIALCALPLGLIASGAAEPLVQALLGPKWNDMVGTLAILGLWGSLRTVQATIGWFVNSIGLSWYVGRCYAVMLAVTVPALLVAVGVGGTQAVAWVMVGNIVAMTGIVAAIAMRYARISLRQQWRAVAPSVVASGPAWLAATGAADLTSQAAPAVSLPVCVGAGALAYAAVVILIDRKLPREVRQQLARVLRPARDGEDTAVPALEKSHVE